MSFFLWVMAAVICLVFLWSWQRNGLVARLAIMLISAAFGFMAGACAWVAVFVVYTLLSQGQGEGIDYLIPWFLLGGSVLAWIAILCLESAD